MKRKCVRSQNYAFLGHLYGTQIHSFQTKFIINFVALNSQNVEDCCSIPSILPADALEACDNGISYFIVNILCYQRSF
jgi:hypothetical protein